MPPRLHSDAPVRSGLNVLVIGVFDLFHRGHLELLRTAKKLGDKLHVVVVSDAFTASYKRSPVIPERDRLEIVRACRYVDFAAVANSADAKPFIEQLEIDLVVHGDDWPHESYLRQISLTEEYLAQRRVKVVYTPYYRAESTSRIIERIVAPSLVPV